MGCVCNGSPTTSDALRLVSTMLGVPFDEVPAASRATTRSEEIEYVARFDAWLAERGYRMRVGRSPARY